MEADWAAEVGFDLPSIDLPWEGFVDLRLASANVNSIEETAANPALGQALETLNAPASSVFTAKCDLWNLDRDEIDPDEFAAAREDARQGVAAYIDVLQSDAISFSSFHFHEHWVRKTMEYLRSLILPNGRVDLIIRPASVDQRSGFGLTLYTAGCGVDHLAAYGVWKTVLAAAVDATMMAGKSRTRTGE